MLLIMDTKICKNKIFFSNTYKLKRHCHKDILYLNVLKQCRFGCATLCLEKVNLHYRGFSGCKKSSKLVKNVVANRHRRNMN